jgi:hypothetical protein
MTAVELKATIKSASEYAWTRFPMGGIDESRHRAECFICALSGMLEQRDKELAELIFRVVDFESGV